MLKKITDKLRTCRDRVEKFRNKMLVRSGIHGLIVCAIIGAAYAIDPLTDLIETILAVGLVIFVASTLVHLVAGGVVAIILYRIDTKVGMPLWDHRIKKAGANAVKKAVKG